MSVCVGLHTIWALLKQLHLMQMKRPAAMLSGAWALMGTRLGDQQSSFFQLNTLIQQQHNTHIQHRDPDAVRTERECPTVTEKVSKTPHAPRKLLDFNRKSGHSVMCNCRS